MDDEDSQSGGGREENKENSSDEERIKKQQLMQLQHQKELEAHLNFLKVKHLEFIKSQQHISQNLESKCEECNIHFSKHQVRNCYI